MNLYRRAGSIHWCRQSEGLALDGSLFFREVLEFTGHTPTCQLDHPESWSASSRFSTLLSSRGASHASDELWRMTFRWWGLLSHYTSPASPPLNRTCTSAFFLLLLYLSSPKSHRDVARGMLKKRSRALVIFGSSPGRCLGHSSLEKLLVKTSSKVSS